MLSTKIIYLKTLYATESKVYDKKNAVNVNMSIIPFLRKKKILFPESPKNLGRANFGRVGRSTANQQCFKVGPMVIVLEPL